MTTLRSSAGHAPATPRRVTVRPITLVLAALLVAAALALTIALAASGGGDQTEASKPVRIAPSAPLPSQQTQPPGVHGPGARP
jgi:hypothetical protein